jgi:hypothetical protein
MPPGALRPANGDRSDQLWPAATAARKDFGSWLGASFVQGPEPSVSPNGREKKANRKDVMNQTEAMPVRPEAAAEYGHPSVERKHALRQP